MYLVAGSASTKNLQSSIINPVNITIFDKYCDKNTVDKINQLYPDGKIFLWALSDANIYKNSFNKIKNGDKIFIKENGHNLFNYYGDIIYTYEENDGNIGKNVWKNPKWKRLIFLKNIEECNIDIRKILELFDWKEDKLQQAMVREISDMIDFIKIINKNS